MSVKDCKQFVTSLSRRPLFSEVIITYEPGIVVKFKDCKIVLWAHLTNKVLSATVDLRDPPYIDFLRGLAEDGPGYEHECNGIMFELEEKEPRLEVFGG